MTIGDRKDFRHACAGINFQRFHWRRCLSCVPFLGNVLKFRQCCTAVVGSLHTSERKNPMENTDWPGAFTDEVKALAFTYTKAARREIRRRENIMADWRRLIGEGMSKEAAAKALRQSSVTLWRWSRRLLPNTFRCGQHSAFEKFNVPLQVISRVQRLCVAGMKQEQAWRSVAKEKFCPPALAEYLSHAPKIPPSFLKASRLSRFSLKVIKGVDFTIMEKRLL